MPYRKPLFIVADDVAHTRNLVAEVLRGAGYDNIRHASDGNRLLQLTDEYGPRVVITTSRLPGLSGLEYTRMIRAGYRTVSRQLSIIAMTDTPTKAFLDAARESGVDEMLVRPFTAQAVLLRVKAVMERPREFIDSAKFIGPCRRRKMVDDYTGPLRRFVDPVEDQPGAPIWESETNRAVVRLCVQKISESVQGLTPGDRRKLREVFAAVKATEVQAETQRDEVMGAAARSLGRYLTSVGAAGAMDAEIIKTHIDSMHALGVLSSAQFNERQSLVDGLERIVDKKLGRRRAA